jgi:ABC-2 type transport system ATP-binding protein
VSAPAIETEGLTKLYGPSRGIDDLTMSVEQGEVFGFLGPNGAGKTTTIRTLLDLLHPGAGSARILGLDSHRDSVAIRARIGNLPGDFGIAKHTTGREALGILARLRGTRDLSYAEALARRLHADLGRPVGELSRGNRQKVGLILALFHRPELLILDEPTGGLDPLMQEEFLALVREERERGATVFLSSHELDEVERICDRVAIIGAGRLIALERIADLMSRAQRRVTVRFADPVDRAELAAVPGVSGLSDEGAEVSFTVSGELDPVVKTLSRHRVADLEVTHPTLEEVFLGYYGEHER